MLVSAVAPLPAFPVSGCLGGTADTACTVEPGQPLRGLQWPVASLVHMGTSSPVHTEAGTIRLEQIQEVGEADMGQAPGQSKAGTVPLRRLPNHRRQYSEAPGLWLFLSESSFLFPLPSSFSSQNESR